MVSQKKAHFVFADVFDICQPIFIILGKRVLQEICSKQMYN